MVRVFSGIDVLLQQVAYKSHRLAMLTNHAACTSGFVPSRAALLAAGFRITQLWSPEHGLDSIGPDGHAMAGGIDPLTGLPVVSLYGDKLEPSPEDLACVDAVLVDLPDIGCRCYTYLWTLTKTMEACARAGKRLILLDRPNPVSGILSLAEGPMLDEEQCSSFIGRWRMPLRHSATLGELARFWQATRLPSLEIEVIAAKGWRRSAFYPSYASSFVPTSPAITSFEQCLLYSGLCLLEATNLSEGRGTPLAFRVAGAPWLDAVGVAEAFNRVRLEGVVARSISFVPEAGKYSRQHCNAVMLHVASVDAVRPVLSAVTLLGVIRGRHPQEFDWAPYPTHVNPSGAGHLDKLFGIRDSEQWFGTLQPDFDVTLASRLACNDWQHTIAPYLLYDEDTAA